MDYEATRAQNIARNEQVLRDLGLVARKTPLDAWPRRKPTAENGRLKTETSSFTARQSPRLRRGDAPPPGDTEAVVTPTSPKDGGEVEAGEIEAGELLPAEQFFSAEQVAHAIVVDSHFRGWVSPDVCAKYGIAESAAEAWEAHGGGTFSFRNPTGETSSEGRTPPSKRRRPSNSPASWSEAKCVAHRMLLKNPNMYFYRHTAPGVEQHMGEWTAEEKALFMQTVQVHGCGDKWGLFASYIPHRVGYQCAAYYRQVILPECLVIDPQYAFTRFGHAEYVGSGRGIGRRRVRDGDDDS